MSEQTSNNSADCVLLTRLADEFAARYRAGERPALQEYLDRYPDLADEIRELFPALVEMEQGKEDRREADLPTPAGPPAPEQIGDFHILREIGRGGMGIVYEAEQVSLGRHVALKVLPGRGLLDPRQLARFQREARAAARLHHTNIVPVFGVGEQDGLHYYVMQFIQGLGLDAVLAELRRLRQARPAFERNPGKKEGDVSAVAVARSLLTGQFLAGEQATGAGPQPPDASPPPAPVSSVHLPGQADGSSLSGAGRPYWHSVARLGVQVAEALAYANSQGVLHRDVKPSNLLLDIRGTVWVTDFGLAKAADSEDLTHTGDIVGTLRYMAPERFQGLADARGDVYALGLTLYELLTLRPAFDEDDRNKLVAQVMHAEPPRPRQRCPEVPRDLETVVLKAMDRDPARRYQSAAELAEDLNRYAAGEPIRARRASAWRRGVLWARRQPAAAGLLAVSVVAVMALVGAGVAWIYSAQVKAAQYLLHIARAHSGWRDGHLVLVERLLDDCPVERRHWEWRYLKRLCHADLGTLHGHAGGVWSVAFSPDGRLLASGGEEDGTVLVWDMKTRQEVHRFKGHAVPVKSVVFSPDGKWLASAAGTRVRVWDVTTRKETSSFTAHKDFILSMAFSPDGRRLVTGSIDHTVRVWDAKTGKPTLPSLKGHDDRSWGVAFSPDGRWIATGGDTTVRVSDAATGQEKFSCSHPGGVFWLAYSPDSRRLASATSGGGTGTIKVWDAITGKEVWTLQGHSGSVAFSPDGTRLATAGGGLVRVWDVTTQPEPLLTLRGHAGGVWGVAFSPDGTRLATGGSDGTVKLWDVTTPQEALPFRAPSGTLPAGLPARPTHHAAFTLDGTRVVAVSQSRIVEMWDTTTGQLLRNFVGLEGKGCASGQTPDGQRIALAGEDGSVNVWDTTTGRQVASLSAGEHIAAVAISPDGRRLATASRHGEVKVWDVATGRQVALPPLVGEEPGFRSVAFSPDGANLAAGSVDRTVIVWDAATGRKKFTCYGHRHFVGSLAFSPDGRRLASASMDTTLRVWDATTGKETLPRPLTGHLGMVYGVVFSPDGRRLASAGTDAIVKIWDATTADEILSLTAHRGEVRGVAFSPDGHRLVSAGNDGVRIWDARPLTPESAVEREAVGLLVCLFAKPLRKGDVLAFLNTSPTIPPEVRQKALDLVGHYREETGPEAYHQVCWAVARQANLNAIQYSFALQQARAASELAPVAERAKYRTALRDVEDLLAGR